MAKGYMVFVEDGYTPQVVHRDIKTAYWQANQLAEKNPDKEILLFALKRRLKWDVVTSRAQSIGSHLPVNGELSMNKSKLVRAQEL